MKADTVKRRLLVAFRRHPVVATGLIAALTVFVAILVAQAVAWGRWELFAQRVDRASAARGVGAERFASWSFAFGDQAVRVRVPVDEAALRAAQGIDTSAMFRASGELRAHYVAHVVGVQSRSSFIADFSEQLRRIRWSRHLDDDEYLELMTRAVQSLPHRTEQQRVRLPIEVAASGFGVCSEKALLLASLMVHEGYQTAMWVFDSQNHVALGVGSYAAQFRDSGYAFIETTRNAYVGEYDPEFLASGPVERPPQFISLGGTTRYQAGLQVEYILGRLSAAKRQAEVLRYYSGLRFVRENGTHRTYEALASRADAARLLANYIRGQTDQRGTLFDRLLRGAADASADDPPAFIH